MHYRGGGADGSGETKRTMKKGSSIQFLIYYHIAAFICPMMIESGQFIIYRGRQQTFIWFGLHAKVAAALE